MSGRIGRSGYLCAIACLADLLQYLQQHAGDALGEHHARVLAYRERYGVS